MPIEEHTFPLVCEHCGNKSIMPVLATVQQESPDGPEDRTGWKLAQCPACLNVTLIETAWCPPDIDESEESWHFLYPLPVSAPQGLPADVAHAYAAATKVRNIDSNAFAVLIGRVLDRVCVDRQVTGASLYDRLTKLANTGEIPPRLAEMAQQLRQLRNIGAHADLGELTPHEVPILDALCRAVLEYVYTAPAMIKRVETRMKHLKTGT